jgi:hypothetical protein
LNLYAKLPPQMMRANRTINGRSCVFWRSVFGLLVLLASMVGAQAVVFQDYFTNRETIFIPNGTLLGDNSAATFEVGEPNHGGKPGGHSLWVSWIAPTNGVATFDTHGSSFDTLLSAYTLNSTNSTGVNQLHEEARNDDDPGSEPASLIQIGAIAGRSYEIAVDGYEGATGPVVLNWSFFPSASPPPIIVSTPNDQAAKQGDTINLTVNMTASANLQLAWFFNTIEDTNQSGTNYVISSLQDTNVGRYQLRITIGNGNNRVRFFTTPVEIQINSDGSTNTLAEDKLLDSPTTPLIGDDGGGRNPHLVEAFGIVRPLGGPIGVVLGYNGSQVFNTTFATTDPAEPPHCGVTGGASYWLMYQPPTNGTMTLDTIGSSYDTVMEVYTYNGALTGYGDLISVACDNDSVSLHGPSRVVFQAVKARRYVVVVDGVNGVRGTAWLNYALNTNLPALPPALQGLVPTQTVTVGSTITLTPSISGAMPMKFVWRKDNLLITNLTIPFLQMTNVTTAQTGNYSLTVSNDLGALTVTMPVHVVAPILCFVSQSAGNLNFNFPTVANFRYTIQQATSLSGPWSVWAPAFFGSGEIFTTNILGPGTKFFRVRVD